MMATRAPDPAFCSVHDKLGLLYFIEASNSISAILLVVGLSFYTTHRFGWGARENFTLAALQGALYMVGALFARSVSQRWGRERSLLGLYAGMTVFAVAVGISATMGWAMAVALLAVLETGLLAVSWPMLQSLVSAAGKPSQLSKRLGLYNIIWSGLGAIAVAGSGAIIQHAPAWAFFGIIAAGHFAAGLLVLHRARHRSSSADSSPGDSGNEARISPPKSDQATLHRHRLALWLSRIALPSTYVVVYSISPALPSLHAIKQLTPTVATLVGSVWLLGRAGAFIITGSTIFWHKRPGLIFLSSITMLFAFVGTIVPGGLTGIELGHALTAMILAQAVFGLSIGTIYAASLYFGMAVSEGSTKHGGYHEALIGLGQVIGPLAGSAMQWAYPGTLWPAVVGISGIVAVTVLIEAAVGLRAAKT